MATQSSSSTQPIDQSIRDAELANAAAATSTGGDDPALTEVTSATAPQPTAEQPVPSAITGPLRLQLLPQQRDAQRQSQELHQQFMRSMSDAFTKFTTTVHSKECEPGSQLNTK